MLEGLFQSTHLLLILGIALLVLGEEVAGTWQGLGKNICGFKSALAAKEDEPSTKTGIGADQAERGTKRK